jgi:hypothetical protein
LKIAVVWSFLQQQVGLFIMFLMAAGENSVQRQFLLRIAPVTPLFGVFSNNKWALLVAVGENSMQRQFLLRVAFLFIIYLKEFPVLIQ